MNILHVTLAFYPAQAWGGIMPAVRQNGMELVRRGHQVTVYCTNLMDKHHEIQQGTFERQFDGLRVVYFHTWHLPWWPGTVGPIWLPELPTYLQREIRGFDVIHINGYRSPMMLAVARAARRAGVPFVCQPHGTLPVIVNSLWVKRAYDRLLGQAELGGVSALIALQDSERRQALDHGVPPERIAIIPNGIDLRKRDQLPAPGSFRGRFGLATDRPLILFLSRINRKKGTDMLVEAFSRLDGLEAQLVIAGPDDGQLAEVQQMIRQYHLEDRVTLTGLLYGSDVLAALQDADLFVLPCRADTFPFVIVEACLTGTPMVITDRCEIAHLVRERVADVVPFDAEAFAHAMRSLLMDRERCERYRASSKALLTDTFSIEAVVDRLEALYARVIAEQERRA